MKTPITMDRLRNHWHYSWWKYLVLVCAAVFGWNIFYTTTAYRPPEEKKVVIVAAASGFQEELNAYMESVRTTEMSDMEQMDTLFVVMDPAYGDMQLSTYVAAGEGDLYVLSKDHFQSYAAQGAFVPLEDVDGLLEYCAANGIVVDKAWRTDAETGEKHLYGIPVDYLPGLKQYFYSKDLYLSIIINNNNDENVLKFLNIVLRDLVNPPATPTDLPIQ